MAVTTKTQYKTSDGKYYTDQKEAEKAQLKINKENLIPFRTNEVNLWVEEVYNNEPSKQFKSLVDNKSTDGSTIQTIVCDVIIKDLVNFHKLIGTLHGDE